MFRSSKHIYAQVIDDATRPDASPSASSLEKDLRDSLKTGADIEAAKAVGKLLAERAVAKGVKRGRVRSRRLHLSRPRQGAGRRRAAKAVSISEIEREHGSNGGRTMAAEQDHGIANVIAATAKSATATFIDKLVHINRVAKVVKGGRRFGFAALVVVGDQKGRVGFGHGKAREVPEAIRKATDAAKRALIRVPLREGRTLHHDVYGRHGAGKVYPARGPCPAPASSPAARCAPCSRRSACRTWSAKSLGSSNPYNMVRATFDALKHQDSPRSVAARRNIKVSTLQCASRRERARADDRSTAD